jgi:hypothetical protein
LQISLVFLKTQPLLLPNTKKLQRSARLSPELHLPAKFKFFHGLKIAITRFASRLVSSLRALYISHATWAAEYSLQPQKPRTWIIVKVNSEEWACRISTCRKRREPSRGVCWRCFRKTRPRLTSYTKSNSAIKTARIKALCRLQILKIIGFLENQFVNEIQATSKLNTQSENSSHQSANHQFRSSTNRALILAAARRKRRVSYKPRLTPWLSLRRSHKMRTVQVCLTAPNKCTTNETTVSFGHINPRLVKSCVH